MGGTKNIRQLEPIKEVWEFLLENGITITAEYIPSCEYVIADYKSRNHSDSSEWKLNPVVFQKICQHRGHPKIDLFASRHSNQVQAYMAWTPDPFSVATDAMKQEWSNRGLAYAFPPFALINRILYKVQQEKLESLLIITPTWPTQTWYPRLLAMSIKDPLLLPRHHKLLTNPEEEIHPLVLNRSLTLAV